MVKLAGLSFLQALLIIGQALFLSATLTDLWLGKPLKSQVYLSLMLEIITRGNIPTKIIKYSILVLFRSVLSCVKE